VPATAAISVRHYQPSRENLPVPAGISTSPGEISISLAGIFIGPEGININLAGISASPSGININTAAFNYCK
jgi:hypothetical protein